MELLHEKYAESSDLSVIRPSVFVTVRKSGLYSLIQASVTSIEYKPIHINACLKSILKPHK